MGEYNLQIRTRVVWLLRTLAVCAVLAGSTVVGAQPTVSVPTDSQWPTSEGAIPTESSPANHIPVVVVDPGHGYRDYGVVGLGGLQEKNVVLDISTRIAKLAADDGFIHVKLTRKGDESRKLIDRANMANRAGGSGPADALVSIHVATSLDTSVTGYQIYYAGGGAGDFDLDGVFDIGAVRQATQVRRWNRQYKRHVPQSETLAKRIDGQMTAALLRRRSPVQHAPLRLLRIVDMPSCLIEVGVISNGAEEARLQNKESRDKCARAIYAGLLDFFDLGAKTDNPAESSSGSE